MQSILLVDDSRFLRIVNERALTKAGYKVMTASDGEEALVMACDRVPDLILLDMLLPKVRGPEVLRALRKHPLTSAIPVIVLSSLPQKNEAQLKKDGATAYFDKSKLDLDGQSNSLVEIVKRTLAGVSEPNADTKAPAPLDASLKT